MNTIKPRFGIFIFALLVLLGLAACTEEDQNPNTALSFGSPGMEMGNRFVTYDVLLLKKGGSSEVYAHIASSGIERQHDSHKGSSQ